MALKDELKLITDLHKNSGERLKHNERLFEIYEGDLLSHVVCTEKKILSEKSFEQAESHIAPINVLKRMIDKLSKLYAKPPMRKLSIESDQDIFDELYTAMDVNTSMSVANEFFNLFKNCMVEPFLDQGKPQLRVIPSDRFLVYSMDRVNPIRPTHYSKIMGVSKEGGVSKTIFYTYTKDEFLIHDQEENVLTSLMAAAGSDGKNPYGRIPGTYINRSRHDLIPRIDSDTLRMTILIPILLSDVNFATKFQCFSIIYGINVTNEGLSISPNVFWNLKTPEGADPSQKPEIGTIKPSVDSDKALSLIKAQLAFWLQSRNIKPGAIGELTADTMASGLSKMVDEMDTSEDRQKQVPFFMNAEADLGELIMHHMHPVWIKDPEYKLTRSAFAKGQTVTAHFAEQRPMVDSSKVIDDEIKQLDKALTTRKRAIMKINPDMDDAAVEQLMAEIKEERALLSSASPKPADPNPVEQPVIGSA